jgi:hypothetical protein
MIPRKKIRAFNSKDRGTGYDQSSTIEIWRTISKAYSGYVHGASPQLMELYFGSPPRFPPIGRERFAVKFEKRGNPRQNTTLIGVVNLNDNEYLVDITDLSIEGCSFVLVDNRCKLALRDKLRIRFKLDSPEFDLIECSAIVRYFGEWVGVEFVDLTDRVKRTLGSHFNLLNS